MPAKETMEKPQQVNRPETAQQQGKQPCGTMFDPETIRKFLDQMKREDK